MDRKCLWATTLVLCNLMRSIVAAETPRVVGELGMPSRIVFHGQQTFTEQHLREAVANDATLILASHPLADCSEFLKLLSRQLKTGYSRAGFSQPVVETMYNPGVKAIMVSIEEGPRFSNGEIEVIGASESITAGEICEHLRNAEGENFQPVGTRRNLSRDQKLVEEGTTKVSWIADQRTNFSEPFIKTFETATRNLFASRGYLDPTLFVELRPESNDTATLVITIREDGPRAVLGSFEVVGTDQNSHDDIVRFLGIEEGSLITSDVIDRMKQKLRSSGRFLKHEIDVISPPFGDGPCVVKIDLCESGFAPPLTEELAPEQQALLQIGRWLENFQNCSDDVCIDISWSPQEQTEERLAAPHVQIRVVICPQRDEALLTVRITSSTNRVLLDSSIAIQSTLLTFDDAVLKARFSMAAPDKSLFGRVQLKGHPTNKAGQTCKLQFGCEVTPRFADKSAIRFECDPAAILEWVGKSSDPVRLHDGQLNLSTATSQYIFDASTGRPLSLRGSNSKTRISLEFHEGLYDRTLSERLAMSRDWPLFQPNEAVASSLIAFLSERLNALAESDSAPILRKWHKLLVHWRDSGRFSALDDFCSKPVIREGDKNTFKILNARYDDDGLSLALGSSLQIIDWAVPPRSWASIILRETLFARFGQASYSDEMLRSLFNSSDAGPLAHLAGAYIVGVFNANWRSDLARRGMKKMAIRDFRADYQPLLRDDTPVGVMLKTATGLLEDCSEEELAMLVDLLPVPAGPDRDQILQSLHHFVTDRDKRWDDQVAVVLDELWKPVLKSYVEQWLADCRSTGSFNPVATTTDADEQPVFGLKNDFQGGELLQIKAEAAPVDVSTPE